MKRLVALALACAAITPAARATAGAPREVPVSRTWAAPPLDAIVPATALMRGDPSRVAGARVVRTMADGTHVVAFDEAISAEATRARVEALRAEGLDVELDLFRQGQAAPDDEGYSKQWALTLVKALDAWNFTTGDASLTVAVVDTGYVDHPDLLPRIVRGYDFITDPTNAGDGDGRDADPHDAGDESEASSSFHGSHVGGIIGAATNNGIGMAGVDWGCRLQPVRVLGVRRHRGRDSDIADGIRWAAGFNIPGLPQNQTPARIINLSFGGPGFSRVLQDAVLAAQSRGVLVIASAGNGSTDAKDNVPAALEGVTSVAAAGPDGKLASYSNFGARVDFMAPGGALFLDAPVGEETPGAIWSTSWVRASEQPVFAYAAGTSQAAAYATGVAALVRAAAPTLPPQVVAAIMRRSARLPKAGCEMGCGAGLIDASRAVAYAKMIQEAQCGEGTCGATNALGPVPLRPEEGCSVAAPGAGLGAAGAGLGAVGGGSSGFGALGLALAIVARRRRSRRRTSRPFVALLAAALSGLLLVGCASSPSERESESQSTSAPTVKIIEPIPTYEGGELVLPIGAGREIEAAVTPSTALDRVELRIDDSSEVIGRLGHAPFRFWVPQWVLGEAGRRLLCITAIDARQRQGELCFHATP